MKIDTVLLDMDGVIYNWNGRAMQSFGLYSLRFWPDDCELASETISHITEKPCTRQDIWDKIVEEGEFSWWLSVPKFPWADRLIKICRSAPNFALCTKPGRSPEGSYAKHTIANNLFGEEQKEMYICRGCKSQLANPTTLLIDDYAPNCEAFRDKGGQALLFPNYYKTVDADIETAISTIQEMIAQ